MRGARAHTHARRQTVRLHPGGVVIHHRGGPTPRAGVQRCLESCDACGQCLPVCRHGRCCVVHGATRYACSRQVLWGRFAECNAAISKMSSQKISHIHEDLTEKCALILYAYRKFCAASAAPTQLILPEAFRTLPLYILGMMKTKPLKGETFHRFPSPVPIADPATSQDETSPRTCATSTRTRLWR